MIKKFCYLCVILFFLVGFVSVGVAVWGYNIISRDIPNLKTIDEYKPSAVSQVFANDGSLIAEFYEEKGKRYPVRLPEVPLVIRNAFLAAEDLSFYKHPGIDIFSILRAFIKNFRAGETKQGGSTITQQVVKNLLLTKEKSLMRKIKEAILSYRLEKKLTKDDIFEIYLNEIYLGNNSYGIKAAVQNYFRKDMQDVTLAEAAMLAGLPQAPSRYSLIKNPQMAKQRQKYVLRQMVKAGFINRKEAQDALKEEVPVYHANLNTIIKDPYFVGEIRRVFTQKWPELNLDVEGLKVYTSVDSTADDISQRGLRKGLRIVDKRRGWRGPLKSYEGLDEDEMVDIFKKDYLDKLPSEYRTDVVYPALVLGKDATQKQLRVLVKEEHIVSLKDTSWANKLITIQYNKQHVGEEKSGYINLLNTIKKGDVIEISFPSESGMAEGSLAEKDPKIILDQTPEIEGGVIILNPFSGEVIAMAGGYSYQRSQFNRTTQSYRQPGSTFKSIVYLAAIDKHQYTPATILYDSPRTYTVGQDHWSPTNFDDKFLGPMTLRTALEKSRNLVAVDVIFRIGVNEAIRYARKLGIESEIPRIPSIALGSAEVTMLEISRAYGVFPTKGVLFPTTMVTKIVDRDGDVLYDFEQEKLSLGKSVINENSAFVLSQMLKGVVDRGTATRIQQLKRPAGGKTGTSNEEMDAWFVGFTPEWVCGVWVGFDTKKQIGNKQGGGVVAAPIFLDVMRDFLDYEDKKNYELMVKEAKEEAERLGIDYVEPGKIEPANFSVPDGVDPFWVDRATGLLTKPNSPGAIYEYFIKGTEPRRTSEQKDTSSYLESADL